MNPFRTSTLLAVASISVLSLTADHHAGIEETIQLTEKTLHFEGVTDRPVSVISGRLGPCLITIAVLQHGWNGKLLIYNHGSRFDPRPINGDLPLRARHYRQWLLDGWMVAGSSFRRQGMIIRDAIEDTMDLHHYIVSRFGSPKRTLLLGESMGAAISILMVENNPEAFHGAVAISGGIARDPKDPIANTFKPEAPIIMVCNSNETPEILKYIYKARNAPVPPAFWWLDRVGHVRLTSEEYLASITALGIWLDTGKVEQFRNGTIVLPSPDSSARFINGGAQGQIVTVDSAYGNVTSNFVAADFESLGIQLGDPFELTIAGHTFETRLGSNYPDFEPGEYFTIFDANGFASMGIHSGALDSAAGIDGSKPMTAFIRKRAKRGQE